METAPKAIDINAVPTREAKLVSDEFSGGEFMVARRNIILSLHYNPNQRLRPAYWDNVDVLHDAFYLACRAQV